MTKATVKDAMDDWLCQSAREAIVGALDVEIRAALGDGKIQTSKRMTDDEMMMTVRALLHGVMRDLWEAGK